MKEAKRFVEDLSIKSRAKLLYNLKKAQLTNDPKLFKKLTSDIWEFRSTYQKMQYRLLAFWDTSSNSLVICTHGFVKKTQKTPRNEIRKAENLRRRYLDQK